MRRREFIAGLGSAAAWPVVGRAQQQPERMRRIGVLLPAAADDTVFQARLGAFLQGLALLGWTIGRNVRIDTHWATANAADIWTLGLQLVWDVVSQSGVGERRQAYVIDTQGRLIAHTDTSLVLSNADMTQLAQVRAARTDGAGARGPGLTPRRR